MTHIRFASLAVSMMLALCIPVTASSQQVLHISRARTSVALTIVGRALPEAESLLSGLRRGCPYTPDTGGMAAVRVGTALAEAVPADVSAGQVLITVTTQANNTDCVPAADDVGSLTAAAVEILRPASHAPITRVALSIADTIVVPTLSRTIRTLALWSDGRNDRDSRARTATVPSTALQLVIPLERFLPVAHSAKKAVALLIMRQEETTVERILLSEQDIDALWRLALPVRAARVGADSLWARRLGHTAPLTIAELPMATAILQQLTAAGDSLASRSLARHALSVEPCLRLPMEAPLAAGALFDQLRPQAYCRPQRPAVALLRGSFVPGLGQVSSRKRTIAGVLVLGIVAQRLHASQVSKRDARQLYQRYVDASSTVEANTFWARADAARRRTDAQILQASALWLGAASEATWFEWRLGRRLRLAAVPPRE